MRLRCGFVAQYELAMEGKEFQTTHRSLLLLHEFAIQ